MQGQRGEAGFGRGGGFVYELDDAGGRRRLVRSVEVRPLGAADPRGRGGDR